MRYFMVPVAIRWLGVVALSGFTAAKGERVGEERDDASVIRAVKAKLAADNAKTLTRVSIETLRGTVYLTGIVESIEVRQHAAELVWQVNGVREVVNSLKIRGRR